MVAPLFARTTTVRRMQAGNGMELVAFGRCGAEWTADDDALLRSLIGGGKPPRSIALGTSADYCSGLKE
jgi:hypothetical protein